LSPRQQPITARSALNKHITSPEGISSSQYIRNRQRNPQKSRNRKRKPQKKTDAVEPTYILLKTDWQ
jgi:hypothetical protein